MDTKKRIVVFAANDVSPEKEKYYFPLAYKTGKLLAEAGFIAVTGGGPGLMDQVEKGAFEAGGETIGVCLDLPGRKQSAFLKEKYSYTTLNARQEKLISLGDGFLSLPGGIGTFYEIFAILSLKRKTEISQDKPFILIDGYFGDLKILLEKMKKEGFVAPIIDSLYSIVRTPEDAVEALSKKFHN